MGDHRHAQIRYEVLDDCFSNFRRNYYFSDLLDLCNERLRLRFGDDYPGIKTRTLRADINYMRERAEKDSVYIDALKDDEGCFYYRYSERDYSIFKNELDENELSQLQETIIMLQRFKGMPELNWMSELVVKLEDKLKLRGTTKSVVGYEENSLYIGLDWFQDIFDAIINKTVLRIEYRNFSDELFEWTIHPYYLKEYNNRWFLYGFYEEKNMLYNIPLDRINDIKQVKKDYIPTNINFETYFDDVIGVTVLPQAKVPVRLKFSKHRFPYVETKALHSTQHYIDRENCIIEINVIPNNELEALILSFGKDVEVIEPLDLRNRIKATISEALLVYKEE